MADPTLSFASTADAVSWFEDNHESSGGFWLKIGKGRHAGSTVNYDEALEVALCFGWIDGQKKSLDDSYWLQRFTPRRARSKWSKRNCGKVDALIASGDMRPAGLREVEAAKADGRWDEAYHGPANSQVPADLRAALDGDPEAAAFFETLTSTNRYAILYRVGEAKKPETRAARIARYVEMCRRHETVHPQR